MSENRTAAATADRWLYPNGPKAPIAWYGGKYYLAAWIIGHFPEHRVYVEPFGGMANVLLKKRTAEVEVFNDLDGRVVNFFRVLRNPAQLAELRLLTRADALQPGGVRGPVQLARTGHPR